MIEKDVFDVLFYCEKYILFYLEKRKALCYNVFVELIRIKMKEKLYE